MSADFAAQLLANISSYRNTAVFLRCVYSYTAKSLCDSGTAYIAQTFRSRAVASQENSVKYSRK